MSIVTASGDCIFMLNDSGCEIKEQLIVTKEATISDLNGKVALYLKNLVERSILSECSKQDKMTFKSKIIIGNKRYTTDKMKDYLIGISRLADAEFYIVENLIEGITGEFVYDFDVDDEGIVKGLSRSPSLNFDEYYPGFYGYLRTEEGQSGYYYHCRLMDNDSLQFSFYSIVNGAVINPYESLTDEIFIFNPSDSSEWYPEALYLSAGIQDKPELCEKLKAVFLKYCDEEDKKYAEENWAKWKEDNESGALCAEKRFPLIPDISWAPKSLYDVYDYLEEVNSLILPEVTEENFSDFDFEAFNWMLNGFVNYEEFAFAGIVWTEEGYKLVGTEY